MVITAVLLLLSLPVLAGKFLPDLKMAICWKPLFDFIAQSAGNSEGLNLLLISRDYTPEYFCYGFLFNTPSSQSVINKLCRRTIFVLSSQSTDLLAKYKHINNLPFSYYLTGLIEGDGTFAIHDIKSTSKKYRPMIIIVFKLADLPLAEYLQELTNCGTVYKKSDRGYVLWQIQDIIGVYTIVNIINGYMRTPKIEALNRTINWLNDYISLNNNSKLPSTKLILSQIKNIEIKGLDNSPIDSNPWLSGFTDADGNFSINIHKRTNRNSIRVQLFYRLEIRQVYHRLTPAGEQVSFFAIMSKIATYLNTSVLS